ncbi:MAG: putative transrane protein [Actinomycetia bacterium]|nr:putative transrane protein [Actinomycetes bacterium]
MFAMVTGLSLAAAAGLNAYIPILVVGLLGLFTHAVTLPHEYAWMTNGWVIAIVAVLLAAEVVLDKVAVVDHVNDAIQTLVRPAAGGAVFAATSAASQVDSSSFMRGHPWIGWVLGIAVAFVVHLTKAGVRPVVNASTLGTATPLVSAVEDAVSLGMSLLAILAPVLALIALVVFVFAAIRLIRAALSLRRRRARRDAAARPG